MLRFTATLFLAMAAKAFAQQPAPSSVEGIVLNANTNAPVARAQVAFRRAMPNGFANPQAPGFAADSGADGKFELTHIEPGSYSVEVQRSGFVTQQYKSQITISPGNRIKAFDFKLIPQAIISGRVLDQDGVSLSGMEVRLLRLLDMNGKQRMLPVGSAQSNDNGDFRLTGIAAGRYFLSAANQNSIQAYTSKLLRYDYDKPQLAFARTYYPASTDEAGARPIDLAAAQTLSGLDIRLKLERVFRVRGKLHPSIPPRDIRIEAVPRNEDATAPFVNKEAVLNEDGTFEISRLFPGPYSITAMPANGFRTIIGKTPVDITQENINNIVLGKMESVVVSGTIRIESTPVGKRPALESIQLSISSMAGGFDSFRQAKPDAAGSFKLENVAPGKHRLGIQNLPDGVWLKSLTLAGRNILNTEFESSSDPIEITFATGVSTITGIVSNSTGQPTLGSVILLGPQHRFDLIRNIPTDQNGRFSLTNIAPGEYSLYAVQPFEAFRPLSEAAKSIALKITIEPNSQKQIDLKLSN